MKTCKILCPLAVLATALRPGLALPAPTTLTVAAAADLKFALGDAERMFEKSHPKVDVKISFGSSGNYFAQISNGAPFDLFLSADVDYPRRLMENGLAETESFFLYGTGQIVVWVPNSSKISPEKEGMKSLVKARTLSIANPKHAPYGRAAQAALEHHGIHDALEARLVLGENVAQAAQFVESGSADAGILALSLALAPPLKGKGRHWLIPRESYPRLEQGGVILKSSKEPKLAREFRSFLAGSEGRALLGRFGFLPPGE